MHRPTGNYVITTHARIYKSSNPIRKGQHSLNKKIYLRVSGRSKYVYKLVIPEL